MKVKEITNKKAWENFTATYSPQSLFQSWNWGEVIKKIENQESREKNLYRMGVYEKNNLVAIAQVEKVTAKRGTFFHIRHGPIFASWEEEYLAFFVDYLRREAKKKKASFVRISPLVENAEKYNSLLKHFGFINSQLHAMNGEYCWVLELDDTLESLLRNMRKTTRYLIRQGQKSGVRIVKSKDKNDISDFLRLYKKTARRHHFVEHKGIFEEFNEFLKDDQTLLFKGYFQKKLLSVALIIFYNHQAIYHHSASIQQKIPVNYLLQWEVIKEAKKRSKKIYNFWGVAPEEKKRHPWRGLTLFKKGFGGKVVEYLHCKDLPLSPLYCTTYLIELVRKFWKGY